MRHSVGMMVVGVAIVFAATGCKRGEPAAPAKYSEPQAQAVLEETEDVIAWAEAVKARGRGWTPVFRTLQGPDAPPPDGFPRPAWVFELGERRGQGYQGWNRMLVDAANGEVWVYDTVNESYMILNLWRVKTGRE